MSLHNFEVVKFMNINNTVGPATKYFEYFKLKKHVLYCQAN